MHHGRLLPPLVLMVALLGSACEASFDPLTEAQTDFFAVFGFLDAAADTQFVRVSPLRPLLDPGSMPSSTQVATVLLGGGASPVAWQDSLVRLDDGTTGLLFYAPFRAEPGASYRLDVSGPGGARTRASTRVPAFPPLQAAEPRRVAGGDVVQVVTWLGLERAPTNVTLAYRLRVPDAAPPQDTTMIVAFREDGRPNATGWIYDVNLTDSRREVLQRLSRPQSDSLVLLGLEMTVELRSEEWARQAVPINIENGFGFFGAVGTYLRLWTLDAQAARLAGFKTP